MNALLRRNPVFGDPFVDVERMFHDIFNGDTRTTSPFRRSFGDITNVKSADIEGTHIIKIALPGVSTDNIELEVKDNYLVWRIEIGEESENTSFISRNSGNYFLGDYLDTENISADLTDGILTISIPHREKPEAKKVAITSGERKTPLVESKDSSPPEEKE